MQSRFDRACDSVERLLGKWWGFGGYLAALELTGVLWGLPGANQYGTLTGAVLLPLLVAIGRRGAKALQVKTDAMTGDKLPDRLEELSEREIEEAREAAR